MALEVSWHFGTALDWVCSKIPGVNGRGRETEGGLHVDCKWPYAPKNHVINTKISNLHD